MSPAALIADARRSAGLTQAQLAERIGVTQPVIARLEAPGSNPRMQTVERLLRATGRRLEWRVAPAGPAAVDESQIAERLRLSPAQRLAAFTASQRNLSALRGKARRVGPA